MYSQVNLYDKVIAARSKELEIRGETAGGTEAQTARIALGEAYLAKQDWENARHWLSRAKETERPGMPPDAEIAINLGRAYEGLGQDQKALDEYTRIATAEPDNADAQAAVKRLKEKLGIKDATPPPPPAGGH